jgi:predicted DCC family thiol-disulfide oxidoreductase YuxK
MWCQSGSDHWPAANATVERWGFASPARTVERWTLNSNPSLRVSNPPPEPLLIWDGDCRFCELWVERWRAASAGRFDDAPSQQVAHHYPEIPSETFDYAVVLIDESGRVFTGAEAIFRTLRDRAPHRALGWAYDRVPGVAGICDLFYRVSAQNRGVASAVIRALWGQDLRPVNYQYAQRWFLRGLGLVYLIAFVSLWVQVDGLIGSNGVLPVADFLPLAREQLGAHAVWLLPTLCWLNSSNGFLHLLCGSGVVVSLLLICGIVPIICLAFLFVDYLSLTIAGQTFLSFQWDILLLETGFLALFLAPVQLWMTADQIRTPRLGLFLLKLLLFKLMFMSGVVKLTAGDNSWWNLTALDYHYWSQPLPTIFAWLADKQPEWFKKLSVAACLVIEIVVPFFIWAPRRIRLMAAALMIGLQIAIAVTGNYCFFNLLTVVLCLLLIEDAGLGRKRVTHSQASERPLRAPSAGVLRHLQLAAAILVLIGTLPLNAWHFYNAFDQETEMPEFVASVAERLDPFRICSGYGLFRVMTKDRREIVIEGSQDGIKWAAYDFKWKPGDPNRAPAWCAPHQPRLDWQMWFAALSTAGHNHWFIRLVGCLLENKPDVTRLLATNPFPEAGPAYIRGRFYRYRFTSSEEHQRTGAWWKREELGEYLPTVSLKQ